jgi:uncharacterized protein
LQGCCLPGQRRLHVRADGALQTCERVGESLVIGHVDSGIDQAAVDGLFSSMSRALGSKCSDCWAVRLCDVCFTVLAPSWGQPGADTAQITEAVCSQIRRSKEETLALYLALREKGPQSLAFLKLSPRSSPGPSGAIPRSRS